MPQINEAGEALPRAVPRYRLTEKGKARVADDDEGQLLGVIGWVEVAVSFVGIAGVLEWSIAELQARGDAGAAATARQHARIRENLGAILERARRQGWVAWF